MPTVKVPGTIAPVQHMVQVAHTVEDLVVATTATTMLLPKTRMAAAAAPAPMALVVGLFFNENFTSLRRLVQCLYILLA